MLNILFHHPKSWHQPQNGLNSNYLQQSPSSEGIWLEKSYIINTQDKNCDIYIVQDNVDKKTTIKTQFGSIFLLSEISENKTWNNNFLRQFDIVIGTQENVYHENYIYDQYICPWQINKSFDDLFILKEAHKLKTLSTVSSDLTLNQGHKKRFAFTNQIKGHFKERIDWFGRGNIFIPDKWDALANYKYSIAIENCRTKDYWTEKLADCFLAYTMPIYYGCTNLSDYFPKNSYIEIDINDLERSIAIIEESIEKNYYEKHLDKVKEARNLILFEYQFFPKLSKLIDENMHLLPQKYRSQTIYPERHFVFKKKYSMSNIAKKISSLIHQIK